MKQAILTGKGLALLDTLLAKGKQLQIEYDEDKNNLKIYELKYKTIKED